jgi:hypothetical protein
MLPPLIWLKQAINTGMMRHAGHEKIEVMQGFLSDHSGANQR